MTTDMKNEDTKSEVIESTAVVIHEVVEVPNTNTSNDTPKKSKKYKGKKPPKAKRLKSHRDYSKLNVKYNYLLSGKEASKVDKLHQPLLDKAEGCQVPLNSCGFLVWKGKVVDNEKNIVVKVRVKVWKFTNDAWAVEIEKVILPTDEGANLKCMTTHGGSLMSCIIFVQDALGANAVKDIMPHWAFCYDLLSFGKTKFEDQAKEDPNYVNQLYSDFGIFTESFHLVIEDDEDVSQEPSTDKDESKSE